MRKIVLSVKVVYLSLHGHHFHLDHGFDGQVRPQRTHVLQPRARIFSNLRLPITLALSRTSVLDSTKIVTAPQTPIAREDLAVSSAHKPRGKQCIIRLESSLLSGTLTPDRLASVCALRGWLNFHTSRQLSPLLVSRRPENAPGGVGPCARKCARSSRRGGVEIDGAQVPRRSRRRRKR